MAAALEEAQAEGGAVRPVLRRFREVLAALGPLAEERPDPIWPAKPAWPCGRCWPTPRAAAAADATR